MAENIEEVKKEETVVDEQANDSKKKGEYLFAVGKRKSAIAQVRLLKKGDGKFTVNNKPLEKVFPTELLQGQALGALRIVGQQDKLNATIRVSGGGSHGQAEAIRHGLARALLQLNPNFRKPLKKAGFLTRDPRKKERNKPGLKKARKAPQWTKR